MKRGGWNQAWRIIQKPGSLPLVGLSWECCFDGAGLSQGLVVSSWLCLHGCDHRGVGRGLLPSSPHQGHGLDPLLPTKPEILGKWKNTGQREDTCSRLGLIRRAVSARDGSGALRVHSAPRAPGSAGDTAARGAVWHRAEEPSCGSRRHRDPAGKGSHPMKTAGGKENEEPPPQMQGLKVPPSQQCHSHGVATFPEQNAGILVIEKGCFTAKAGCGGRAAAESHFSPSKRRRETGFFGSSRAKQSVST